MPGNVRTIAQAAVKTEEQINEEYQEQELERQLRPRVRTLNKRMRELCRVIWSIYDNYYAEHPDTHMVPSLLFDFHFTQVMPHKPSTRTILKLKKLLDIYSVRRDGVWHWSRPTYDMNGILREYHDEQLEIFRRKKTPLARKLLAMRRPAAVRLMSAMRELHYDAPREAVYTLMSRYGYARNTIIMTKSSLGIVSIKNFTTGLWHWVYAIPEHTEWLVSVLSEADDYTREQSDIYELASSKGWSERVVDQAVLLSNGSIYPRGTSWAIR